MKKLKAWTVVDDQDANAEVVFSNSKLEARRIGAGKFKTEVEHVSIYRAAQFDQYSLQGFVPPLLLLNSGWTIACQECANKIAVTPGISEATRDKFNFVECRGQLFCSSGCLTLFENKIVEQNHQFELFKQKIVSERPDLNFTDFSGEWPSKTFLAKFKFAGCTHDGTVSEPYRSGRCSWQVAPVDRDAWNKHQEANSDKCERSVRPH
ncbi:MAG: hypothetical protein EOO52_13445 [Gammaproteobacteria bacterium]|nr:MAG: hypothetical protein EOO52_13445 [Gammaproteobacteria bacterium]